MRDLATFLFLTAAIASVLLVLIAIAIAAVRWARKGSPGASFVGWALLLLSAGMNPQPPPQHQVEEANREKKIKKEVGAGEPRDSPE